MSHDLALDTTPTLQRWLNRAGIGKYRLWRWLDALGLGGAGHEVLRLLNREFELFGLSQPISAAEITETLAYVIRGGQPQPPPSILKPWMIARYQRLSGYISFIETGTCYGATIAAIAPLFERCITIELSRELFQEAKRRLRNRPNVKCLHGSSVDLLPSLLVTSFNSILWIDAHYSCDGTSGRGNDPLRAELAAILEYRAKSQHIILIDDARALGVRPSELMDFVWTMRRSGYEAYCRNDVWRILPHKLFMMDMAEANSGVESSFGTL